VGRHGACSVYSRCAVADAALLQGTEDIELQHLPVIDLAAAPDAVARGIADACRAHGFFFFYGIGHDAGSIIAATAMAEADVESSP
jgi:hypothetical protein